jgi:hypothetical protein
MLTNEQIENSQSSINDVADLKMRLDIATESLRAIKGALLHEQPHKASELAVNDLARITGEHNFNCDGVISIGSDGSYSCKCYLVATADS